ncbi:MAG TPA: hypothetical protein VJ180_06580, partial [Pyrinomonadaceae bacterium]|nr:hypothetical protein [Pyrinomonadaceae bacterium]
DDSAETIQDSGRAAEEPSEIASPESSQVGSRTTSSKRTERPWRPQSESEENQVRTVREETRARRVSEGSGPDNEELREDSREARRQARREQREIQRRDRNGRDLFRIREIFEGSPTP